MNSSAPETTAPAEPLVSVIIPTHNRAGLLKNSIQSVLAQSYEKLELIVVDDASTDSTAEVVRSFSDERLRYVRLERNRRAAAARNVALSQAQGSLIAFNDDDDVWLVHKLERQVAHLQASPGVGLSLAAFVRVGNDGVSYIGGSQLVRQLRFNDRFFRRDDYSLISTPNWLVRRSCLDQAGVFDERLQTMDDWELALRLFDVCRVEHLEDPLWIQYQKRPAGSGLVDNERHFVNDYTLLAEKYSRRWPAGLLAEYSFAVGTYHARTGAPEAAAWFRKAIALNPAMVKAYLMLLLSRLGGRAMDNLVRGRRWLWSRTRFIPESYAAITKLVRPD